MKSIILLIVFTLLSGCSSSTKKEDPNSNQIEKKINAPSNNATISSAENIKKISAPQNEIICSRSLTKRTLLISESAPKGCKLFYSNFSSKKPVAWSSSSIKHCTQTREKIQTALKNTGYACEEKK